MAVDVTYNGAPQTGGFGYFVFGTRAGKRFAWSLSEPYGAREWWPCKDHPSDKADSVRVTVTVPSAYRVGSQGLLVSETTNGANKTYDWVSHYPDFELSRLHRGQRIHALPGHVQPARSARNALRCRSPCRSTTWSTTTARDALPFGWAPVRRHDQRVRGLVRPVSVREREVRPLRVHVRRRHGAPDHDVARRLIDLAREPRTRPPVVSATKSRTKTWPHIWLNEGFATYAALLTSSSARGRIPGTYETQLASTYADARNAIGTLVLADTSNVSDMFGQSRIYSKGCDGAVHAALDGGRHRVPEHPAGIRGRSGAAVRLRHHERLQACAETVGPGPRYVLPPVGDDGKGIRCTDVQPLGASPSGGYRV